MAVKYHSTNQSSPAVGFREALLRGQAPDRGLYTPFFGDIPHLSGKDIAEMRKMSYPEIAFRVMKGFVGDEIPERKLMGIMADAYDFEVPIEHVAGNRYVMRLDRGPTASFKDFAARVMARQMQYFMTAPGSGVSKLVIPVATSGDTGGAVASAFHGLDNINILILFPKDEVTGKQRRQMTTLGGNVTAVAVEGKFDDCQYLVKRALGDDDLRDMNLSSANSINIGRLLPQAVYYFYAHSRLEGENIGFSVPSGNFGNGTAALITKWMGLPVERLIFSVNGNDEFPTFMETETYNKISPSRNCLSNAMNVGHPSNLARIFYFYGGRMNENGFIRSGPELAWMRQEIFATSVSDEDTRRAMANAYNTYLLLLEPHGAVAWEGLDRYLSHNSTSTPYVALETAHPAKFAEVVENTIGVKPGEPASLAKLDGMEEHFHIIQNDYAQFKELLRASA
jgi:threonine synthase